ncbi:hypothetical protein K491DRAFT_694022 [Lophiostoma macrostomum CBS 122681]|uniref:Uncharacterized protein n=1 Tax=Lophiostoma macrostomum CBS 122681 TaxID=1314788 RepID=A0A6A6T5S1_9PLEO|nr:hypothetical protein K491DRAFT_694022 [Lophiostoma macrostomum CBS 122681]
MEDREEWENEWYTLTRIWKDALGGDLHYVGKLVTPDLQEEWNATQQRVESFEDDEPKLVGEYSKFLVKVAKRLGKSGSCIYHPWTYREGTLKEVYEDNEEDGEEIWPQEGKWKQSEKMLPLNHKRHTEILSYARTAYDEGRTDDAFEWLQPETSDLVQHTHHFCRSETRIIDKVLGRDKKFFQDKDNKEQITESFLMVKKILDEEENAVSSGGAIDVGGIEGSQA